MRYRLIMTLCAVFMLSSAAFPAVPASITVQGKLTDSTGVAFPAGAKTFTFRVFDAQSFGTQIWPAVGGEIQSITSSSDGLWIGLVGAVSPLNDIVFADSVRWLEINVDGTTLPRARLVAGPFAFRVATVDGATGGTITSKVTIGSTNINTGDDAFVAGSGNKALAEGAAVTGGSDNYATARRTFIGGGDNNVASDIAAVVVGGADNLASSPFGVVCGGSANTTTGAFGFTGGGLANVAGDSGTVIGGGSDNAASGRFSTVGGGRNNKARGRYSVIAGGGPFGGNFAPDSNAATGSFSAIVGGTGNLAKGENSVVGGGEGNSATAIGSAVVGGGFNAATLNFSFVGGGGGTGSSAGNSATNIRATVVGGAFNAASGNASFVGGGEKNRARGSYSVVTGGGGIFEADSNTASGEYSTIPGGRGNLAGADYTFAAGRRAKTNHPGTFVWADSTDADFASSAADQFLIRADGGVGIGTNAPEAPLHVLESSAGSVTANTSSIAVFERGGNGYLSVLTPDANERGILFGEPSDPAAGGIVYNNGSTLDGLQFRVNGNSTKMVLDSLGRVGIGTTAPEGSLHVFDGSAGTVTANSSSTAVFESNATSYVSILSPTGSGRGVLFGGPEQSASGGIIHSSSRQLRLLTEGQARVFIDTLGNVGIGVLGPTNILQLPDNTTADPLADAWTVYSSRRWKTDIRTIDRPIEKVTRMRGVYYKDKGTNTQDIGLIAEEVGEVIPEVVAYEENGVDAKSVDYARLVALLIESVKEQQKQIDELKSRLDRQTP